MLLKLAFRNILRNRRRSLLTLLSMGGGFFLLCLTLSLSEGSYSNIINIFTQDHTGHVQVHKENYLERPSLYKTINNSEDVIAQLTQQSNVVAITPRIYGSSLAYGKNKTFPAQVIGIDPEKEATATRIKSKVNLGQYLTNASATDDSYYPAMLGYSLAKNLKLTVGDELVLISQGLDGSIANDIFDVVAIVGDENSYERMNVYISLTAMREFLSMQGSNKVHELAIILNKQSEARAFAAKAQREINNQGNSRDENPYDNQALTIEPWQVVESSFYNSMQADKKGSYISMAVIIFIVAIGVLNTILMGTLERTREFGVLKAIGTRPFSVFALIMLESFFLAMMSCIIGLILSIPTCLWLANTGIVMPEPIDMGGIIFDTMLGEVSWFVLLVPSVVVIFSTLLVSFIPAYRAAKISPLKALQAV